MIAMEDNMTARETINCPDSPIPPHGFVQAVRAAPFVFMSGVMATDYVAGVPPTATVTPGLPLYALPMHLQTEFMLSRAAATLRAAGARIEDTVTVNSFSTDITQAPYAREIRSKYLHGKCASTAVIVPGLPVKDAVVTMDLIALMTDSPFTCERITTDRAPVPPNGRYPQAVKVGPYIFTAGQIPTDFTSTVAPVAQIDPNFPFFGRSIKRQTAFILDNIGAVLEAAGSSLRHVVKATVFLADSRDFQGLDEVWKAYFPDDPPARTVAPAVTLFPDAKLEIHTIAITADGPVRKEIVFTDRAPRPTIHQSQAVKAGDFVFLSGLMATDFEHAVAPAARVNPMFPYHSNSAVLEADYVMDTADAILGAAGSSLSRLIRWQAFLPDLNGVAALHDSLRARSDGPLPVGTIAQSSGPLIVPACGVLFDGTAS
jgi:reactive intermediate/imine deaminase